MNIGELIIRMNQEWQCYLCGCWNRFPNKNCAEFVYVFFSINFMIFDEFLNIGAHLSEDE